MKKFIRSLAAALKATLVVLMILVIIGSGLLLWLSIDMISGNGSVSNPVAQLLEPLYTKHIETQLTNQADSIVERLDDAIAEGKVLEELSLEEYKSFSELFGEDLAGTVHQGHFEQLLRGYLGHHPAHHL